MFESELRLKWPGRRERTDFCREKKLKELLIPDIQGGAPDVEKVRNLRKGTGFRKQRIPLEQTHEKKVECEYPDCKNQR